MTPSAHAPFGLRSLSGLARPLRIFTAPVEAVGFAASFTWEALAAIPFTLRRYRSQTVKTITIGNGRTAHATLGIVDIGALPKCPPTTAAGLRVFPPNQTASKVIPFPFPACGSSSSPVFLRIRPVTK